MVKTLILGAAYVDVVINVPQLPFSGGDVTGDLRSYIVGGSAFNVYGAMHAAQAEADLFVPVGQGQYADLVRAELKRRQIPELLPVTAADNGWDIAMVEPSGERSFLTIPGIDQIWQNDWFDRIDLADYRYFYISGYQVEDEQIASQILGRLTRRADDAYILFDASPRMSHLTAKTVRQLLQKNVIIHCNEDEIGYFGAAGASIDETASSIFAKTQSPVIVTLGARGTYYFDGQRSGILPADHAEVINTSGAGDTHCGGLLAGLASGKDLVASAKLANTLAAKVVSQENSSL
ncbi:ribokinase [Secundilactobacillus pentosiphilus]|uniref:Ribokinase n=1 Tax=Secundilactobacillus pentosiphilus TaxID=1714682 RepID=A0A1Z5IW05_9LACO|nr:PfkB family carbohydrate kinase [Secundilactobacillus pentosiphilus]GAX05782.1 ribokinase [Secundilactobacillus pentosiphilus]